VHSSLFPPLSVLGLTRMPVHELSSSLPSVGVSDEAQAAQHPAQPSGTSVQRTIPMCYHLDT
jgi:hypothetical protein